MVSPRIATVLTIIALAVVSLSLVTGCKDTSTSAPASASTMVNMVASFSKSGTVGNATPMSLLGIDSLRIDSAVVVISRIRFVPQFDTAIVDTGDDEHESHDMDSSIVFKGPFVVHIHDTVAINFADQMLPAGAYNAIIFKIHPLGFGERHEDSDERSSHGCWSDSGLAGSSITVWGAVYKDSAWRPFTFALNEELKFKVKGNFNVPASTSSIRIALNINMDDWFRNPFDGSLLDPTDHSFTNMHLIREAIEKAFGNCRGGHDRGDGHPDD